MNLKITLLILLFNLFAQAKALSINPQYRVEDLYNIFSNFTIKGSQVSVQTFSYNKNDYVQKMNGQTIALNDFKMVQKRAENVFRAKAGFSREGTESQGTAFHVGGNFVLTNYHVYRPEQDEIKDPHALSCGSFSVIANDSLDNREFSCRKVHYCSKDFDFCLIEMNKIVKKKLFSGQVIKTYELKQLNNLEFNLHYEIGKETVHRVIGNPQFKGIHASKGIGLKNYNKWIMFYSPVFQGNSGGPLLNEAGEVIGVVRAQSPELVSDRAYNFAVPLSTIKNFLNQTVSGEVLNQLNF